jgi:polysaccharide export outer membrane protein
MPRTVTRAALALLSLCLLGSAVRGQESGPAPAPPPVSPLDQAYTLVVDDRIQIYVEGHDTLTRDYVVPANGEVSFPPVGRVNLLGKTQDDLAEEIKRLFVEKGHLQDPTVYVLILTYAPRQAFLVGAVTRTLDLPVHRKYGIVEVIAMAGVRGFGGEPGAADLRDVTIMRKHENGTTFRFSVNVEDYLYGGDFRKNVVIMPNDIIFIQTIAGEEDSAAVYILGKVAKPGRYPFRAGRDKMTLLNLISLAGDFHQFADESNILILRKQGNRTVGIEIDFDEIIDRDIQDPVLEPDDIVYVPESPI